LDTGDFCRLWTGQDSLANAVEINPLNAKLNPICHFMALLGAHHILHVNRIRVKKAWNYISTVSLLHSLEMKNFSWPNLTKSSLFPSRYLAKILKEFYCNA
jgi:hypothetical protein